MLIYFFPVVETPHGPTDSSAHSGLAAEGPQLADRSNVEAGHSKRDAPWLKGVGRRRAKGRQRG